MDLRTENVTFRNKDRHKIKEIYTSAFPKEDRMPFWFMLLMANSKNTDFLSFYDQNNLCGFIYTATIEKLTFVMFFAVDENIRSKGYGSHILDKTQSMYKDNKIIVSIERCDIDAPDIEERVRRKRFYSNNGYTDTGYLVELGNKKQEILIKNGEFDDNEFLMFFKKYSNGATKPKILKKDS